MEEKKEDAVATATASKPKHIRNYAKALKMIRDYHRQWRSGKLTKWDGETDAQFEKRVKEHLKACDKSEANAIRRLENADKAGRLKEIEAEVNWGSRQGAYGYQCHANVWVSYEHPEHGTASSHVEGPHTNGCGYDKASTALSDAFMRLDAPGRGALDRWVIEAGAKVWAEYAIESRPYPHFEFGGKGMTTFTSLFHNLGCKHYKGDKFAFPKFEIDYRQNRNEDYFIHVIRRDLI